MVSPFAAAMRIADRTLDKVFAERVRVEPQLDGEYLVMNDPERPPYETKMVVGVYPGTIEFSGMGRRADKPQIAGEQIHVWYHESKLPSQATQWPREGDRLVLLERPGEHALIIQRIEPDGVGRRMARCTRTPAA